MKQLLLVLCTICGLAAMLPAQSTDGNSRCWNFDEACANPDYAFDGCIQNASSAHGTPDNEGPKPYWPPLAANGGVHYAHMYVQYYAPCPGNTGEQGEGILLHFNFQAGHTYKISFQASKKPIDHYPHEMRLILVNMNGSSTGGGNNNACSDLDMLPSVPADHQDVVTINGSSIIVDAWTAFTQTITPNSSFGKLWIRPRVYSLLNDNATLSGQMFIDNVCIEECPSANFEFDLCKIETNRVRVTLLPDAGTTGQWKLFNALDCNGGTGDNNIGTQSLNINWLDVAHTQFEVPHNSGCYILQYTANHVDGCPDAVVRKIFDSSYGGGYSVVGAFSVKNGCASPTYPVSFSPKLLTSTVVHHWELHDAYTNQLLATYTTFGSATLNITANYGVAYRMDHWASEGSSPYCYRSDVNWQVFGCGTDHQGLIGHSGSHAIVEGAEGIPDAGERTANNRAVRGSLLYPNPSSSEAVTLQVANLNGGVYDVNVFDAQGQVVRSFTGLATPELRITRDHLTAGLYVVKVNYATGEQETLKLILL